MPDEATPAATTRTAGRWVLLVTILGSALVIIDVTAMNVIAPQIQQSLDTSVAAVQWVIGAYTLFLASVTLTGGALADRYGRRRVYGLGLALFAAASVACGLAPGAAALIVSRALQGLAGALMLPGSLALIAAHFPVAQRGRAIGTWASMSGLAAVVGPVLGGVLSDIGSWRWIFFLNVPIGLGLLVPLLTKVAESRRPHGAGRLDVPGAVLATLGLGGVTYGLIQSGVAGWTHVTTLAGFAGGALTLALFLWRESRTQDPMLPLTLFRDRRFAGANLLTLFVYAALAAGMFFVPMRLILLDGYSPTRAGIAMVPTILLISLLSPLFGSLTDRYGPRLFLLTGPLVAALGFAVLALPGYGAPYLGGILWGLVLVGIGMAIVIAPLTATVLGSVPGGDVGVASGVNNAVSRLGALLAIAASGAIALGLFGHVLTAELDSANLNDADRAAVWDRRIDLAAAEPPQHLDDAAKARVEAMYDDAFLFAYRGVQLVMAASAALGGLIGAFSIRGHLAGKGLQSGGDVVQTTL